MSEAITTTVCNVSEAAYNDHSIEDIKLYRLEHGEMNWHLQLLLVHFLLKFGDSTEFSVIRKWFNK